MIFAVLIGAAAAVPTTASIFSTRNTVHTLGGTGNLATTTTFYANDVTLQPGGDTSNFTLNVKPGAIGLSISTTGDVTTNFSS